MHFSFDKAMIGVDTAHLFVVVSMYNAMQFPRRGKFTNKGVGTFFHRKSFTSS